jgi:hypothetical protein
MKRNLIILQNLFIFIFFPGGLCPTTILHYPLYQDRLT